MRSDVKIQYKKPLLELCKPNKVIETKLTDRTQMSAYNITLIEKANETAELTFSMPFENSKICDQDCEKLVKLNGEYYVIKEVSVNDSNSRVIEVRCIHESVELKGVLCETIDVIGVTVANMFQAIVDSCTTMDIGYTFKGTDIPDTTMRALQNDSEVSVFENLVKMAEVFQAVLEFSVNSDGVKQVYLRKEAIDRGKYVKKSNGLKQLNITYDSNELFTRLIPFGDTDSDGIELNIMGVNPTGKSYVENYDYFLAKGMTYEEIKNNPRCNQEMVYRNSDIIDENDLYRIALEELEKCCVPVLDGTIDMVDFSVFEGSSLLAPVLSEEVIVIDKDINFSIKAKITGIERCYDNPLQTKVTISNVIRYTSVFRDLVYQGDKIDKITSTDSNGNLTVNGSYVQGKIDAHKAQIVGMLGAIEKPEDKYAILFECREVGNGLFGALALGCRGILISNELDGKNEWIWRTAINANAISADEINTGVLNANLIKAGILESFNGKSWIDMENGSFSLAGGRITYSNTDGFKIFLSSSFEEGSDLESELNDYKNKVNQDINDINGKLENIQGEFGDAFADGIIDEAEANMIKRKLADLNKEKGDIDIRYTTIYNNVNLVNPSKQALFEAYNSFIVKHNKLIATIEGIIADGIATVTERAEFDKALEEYAKVTPALTKAFDEALNTIALNMSKEQINDYNDLVQGDIKNVADSVTGLENVMNNAFRDGIIDEAEYIAILESLTRLQAEKTDIDKNYENLSSNLNLTGAEKSTLNTKYNAYVTTHNNLLRYVNESIGDRIATDEEKIEIDRLIGLYNIALAEYGVAQTEAINKIADTNANTILKEYKTLVDKDFKDVNEKIKNLTDNVGDAIIDGIIDEAETLIIYNSIKELDKEKKDIDTRYTEIYKNSGLSNGSKETLKTTYTAYINAYNSLISQILDMIQDGIATAVEKTEYEKRVTEYNESFAQLSKQFDMALSEIANSNANTIMENLKKELQGNINDVKDIADKLKNQIGDYTADGILDEAEKQSIRLMLVTLSTEKADITNQYNTLYNNTDLTGTAKSNLSNAYINYNNGYNSLLTIINSLLNKPSISSGDRDTLNTAFENHDRCLAVYSQRVNEALDAISSKKAEDSLTEAKDYYNSQIIIDEKRILTTVSATYATKSDLASLNVGVRNRALDTENPKDFTFTNKSNDVWQPYTVKNDVSEQECTIIFEFTSSMNFATDGILRFQSYYKDTNGNQQYSPSYDITSQVKGKTKGTVRFNVTWGAILSTENTCVRFRADYVSGYFKIFNLRVVKGNMNCDWTPAPEDTSNYIDDALSTMVDDFKNQIDGKIETWNQTSDPSTAWTTASLKQAHVGDLWYNPNTQLTKRWNGSEWVLQQGAEPLAMEKRRVFVATPTVPYDAGDLWVTSTSGGELKTCIKSRSTGSYTASEWVAGLKYTDDSLASKLETELKNIKIGGRNILLDTAFEYETSPWTFSANTSIDKSTLHEGRNSIKFNQIGLTANNQIYFMQKVTVGASVEVTASIYVLTNDLEVFGDNEAYLRIRFLNSNNNLISTKQISIKPEDDEWYWKRKVLTETTPEATAYIEYVVAVERNGLLWCSSPMIEKGNLVSDWTPAPEDTLSYTDNLIYDLKDQIDGKIETWNQENDPSTAWTTTILKQEHIGDLWYVPSTSKTYRWSGSTWKNQPEAESLAKTKKRVFSTAPTPPYDLDDLWIVHNNTIRPDAKEGEVLSCIVARTASGGYYAEHWGKKVSYTDDTYAKSVESKFEQRADSIELSVTKMEETAGVSALSNTYAMKIASWTKTGTMSVGRNATYNLLNIYTSVSAGEIYAICQCDCEKSKEYEFSMNIGQYSESKSFYRIRLQQYLSNSGTWSTIKEFTGKTTGTREALGILTHSFTTNSFATKLRVWVGKLDGETFDIWAGNINIIKSGGVYSTLASIKVLEGSIESRVEKDGIGTLIQQNYNSVRIAWNNNSKYVQFESGGLSIYNGALTTSEKRAVFNEAGNHFWRDGYYLGKIGTNQLQGDSTKKGIVFDLEYEGAFMSWGVKKSSTATVYTMMWTYANKALSNYSAGALHGGADIDMHYYTLKNVAFEGGGITGTMNFVQVLSMGSNGVASRWTSGCKLQFQNGILINGTWNS